MRRVAAGCPTTVRERTVARSSVDSGACFLARLGEFFGFSIPLSDLIISAGEGLTRLRRRSWGGFGSFILLLLCLQKQQFTSLRHQKQKNFRSEERRVAKECRSRWS